MDEKYQAIDFEMAAAIYSNDKTYGLQKFQRQLDRAIDKEKLILQRKKQKALEYIPYAKKGQYTALDLLNNPFKYLLKRCYNFAMNMKHTFPANFPMGIWLYDFSKEQIKSIHPSIKELYTDHFLENTLEKMANERREENWHIITNPINLSLICKYYDEI